MKVKSESEVFQSCATLSDPHGLQHTRLLHPGDFPGKSTGVGCHCILLIIGDWNAKVGSQETPGVTGKFGLGVQNKAGQRLIEFCQENALVITTLSSNNTNEDSTHGHYQMINTKVRLFIVFAAKNGEVL